MGIGFHTYRDVTTAPVRPILRKHVLWYQRCWQELRCSPESPGPLEPREGEPRRPTKACQGQFGVVGPAYWEDLAPLPLMAYIARVKIPHKGTMQGEYRVRIHGLLGCI